jgi:1,4-dihydroxy-6-naphthoate synthase
MFWGLASGEVDPLQFEFEHVLRDIQTLNEWALEGKLEVTAISLAAYPLVQEEYVLLPHGASMGSGYGPIVVAREELSLADLRDVEIAVPGELTTAFLVLRMCLGTFRYREVPFDRILDEVSSGSASAGLLIHEGQLSYREQKLHRVQDLGEWWKMETGLPLPLGGNALRRDLDRDTARKCCDVLRDTVQYALDHRKEALDYALEFARGMDRKKADKFVGMYVNSYTLELGKRAEDAVALLFKVGRDAGFIPVKVEPEFID